MGTSEYDNVFPSPVKTYHTKTYPAISATLPAHSAKGKTVLITGGASGIGLAISTNFASAGATAVIILARRPEPLAAAKKSIESQFPATRVHTFTASVTDNAVVEAAMKTIRSSIGEPDILILCGAMGVTSAVLAPNGTQLLSDMLDTNVKGNYNLIGNYLSVPSTAENPKTIIDISSVASHVQQPWLSLYGATKVALSTILGHLANDAAGLGHKDLRIHSMHPGICWTDMAKASGVSEDAFPWDDVELPGNFAVWLASPEGAFLHGRMVWSNWDVEELKARKADIEKEPGLLKFTLQM